MSIRAEITARVQEGRLVKVIPLMPTGVERRAICATLDVWAAVDGPWTSSALSRRFAKARSLLESFIRGDVFVVRVPPSKNVNTVLALLEPGRENVWEFRIGDPRPGLRIFGRFAELDTFIATNWALREALDERGWRDEMVRCKRVWTSLFAYPPLHGNAFHDYISNARLPI